MRAAECVYVDAYTHLYVIHIQRYEFYKYVNQGTDPSPHCFFFWWVGKISGIYSAYLSLQYRDLEICYYVVITMLSILYRYEVIFSLAVLIIITLHRDIQYFSCSCGPFISLLR